MGPSVKCKCGASCSKIMNFKAAIAEHYIKREAPLDWDPVWDSTGPRSGKLALVATLFKDFLLPIFSYWKSFLAGFSDTSCLVFL